MRTLCPQRLSCNGTWVLRLEFADGNPSSSRSPPLLSDILDRLVTLGYMWPFSTLRWIGRTAFFGGWITCITSFPNVFRNPNLSYPPSPLNVLRLLDSPLSMYEPTHRIAFFHYLSVALPGFPGRQDPRRGVTSSISGA